MPSTFSPNLRFELIAAGEQVGTWGDTTNRNLGSLIEQAVAGSVSISLPDADYTLTAAQGVPDQARAAVLVLGGVLTASRNVIAPSVSKVYIVRNGTTGGQNIVLKTAAGTGVTIPPGRSSLVFSDGTNFYGGLTYVAGPLTADSLTLATPLAVASGGTGGADAATARTNLGLGSAAILTATSTNSPNTAVQRDASGNFSAGTISANLNGNATTSNNATQFGGQSPSFYAKSDLNYDWVSVFAGSSTSINLFTSFGAGFYWVARTYNSVTTVFGITTIGTPLVTTDNINLASVSQNVMYTANIVTDSLGVITNVYKLRKL